MAKSKKRIDPEDVILIEPEVADEDTAEGEAAPLPSDKSLAVQDSVAKAISAVEEKAKAVAVKAREKDLETIESIEDVTTEILQAFKEVDWRELASERPKDVAIAYGILMDKREKLLAYDARRSSAKKKRTVFVFDFANQKAAVTVDDGGDDE